MKLISAGYQLNMKRNAAGYVIMLVLLLNSCRQDPAHGEFTVLKDERHFTVNMAGKLRTGALYLPQKNIIKAPPLVIALHGMGGSGDSFRSRGFDLEADRLEYIVVYPDGENGGWSSLDDNAFFGMIIDGMHRKFNIDTTKVFMTGHSLGAIQCHESALVLDGRIAAIAPVCGPMSAESAQLVYTTGPAHKAIVPAATNVMMIHSLDDEVIPYEGKHLWNIYSVNETVSFWRKINGCQETAANISAPPKFRGYRWHGSGSDCLLYIRQSGGHGWPSAATELIMEYFDKGTGPNRSEFIRETP